MPNPESFPEKRVPKIGTIRHSQDELKALIAIREKLLDGEPDSFGYELSLKGLQLRQEKLFGTKPIESIVSPESNESLGDGPQKSL